MLKEIFYLTKKNERDSAPQNFEKWWNKKYAPQLFHDYHKD